MNLKTNTLIINWLNEQLDKIIFKTNYINEMIYDTDNGEVLTFLHGQLKSLEKQCEDIGKKIDFEKKEVYLLLKK
jgi:hypothetical protein